jgi:sugar lactone lactonase YvrE
VKRFPAFAASDSRYGLAEGPVWDADRNRALWVDVNAGTVHRGRFEHGRVSEEHRAVVDHTVGAVVTSAAGDLLVAGARCLHTVTVDGTIHRGPRLIPSERASRFNDGGCDPQGRFLVGSLALDARHGEESLIRLEETGTVTVLDDDLTLSNGLAFAPDGALLYSVDTTPGTVWKRPYEPLTGAVGPRAEFLHIDDGLPDGLCVDSAGNLWIAIWGAGEIRCFTPAGDPLATVEVPAPNTSSVAFIGPRLDTLLITTAAEQLSTAQLDHFPDSGRLFTAAVGVLGAPVAPWAGLAGPVARAWADTADPATADRRRARDTTEPPTETGESPCT